jgi:hypothetical protein
MLPYMHERVSETGFIPQLPTDQETLFLFKGPLKAPTISSSLDSQFLTASNTIIKPQIDIEPSTY